MAKSRADRPGVTPLLIEIPNGEYAALDAFCGSRGTTKRAEVLTAIRRHLASPPPLPEAAPLPPAQPKRGRGRPRKEPTL